MSGKVSVGLAIHLGCLLASGLTGAYFLGLDSSDSVLICLLIYLRSISPTAST